MNTLSFPDGGEMQKLLLTPRRTSVTEVGRTAHGPGFPDGLAEWGPPPVLTAHLTLETDAREWKLFHLI